MSDLLSGLAARSPSSIVGYRAGEAVTQAAFLARVSAWRALALRTPGRNVALYLEDTLEFSAALLGAWQAGKTVWLTADTLPASCAALATRVDAFLGAFPQPCEPEDGDRCELPWQVLAGDFAALVVHTSGSTGAPQAIPKTLWNMMSEVATLERQFGPEMGDCDIVATVSHQHIYGLLFRVLWPLAAGRAIHAFSLKYPEQMAQELRRAPCILVASPAHLKRLPEHVDWSGCAAMLCAVFSSGGMLPAEASAAAARLMGHVPTEIYGSSESGGIAWRRRMPASTGTWESLPGVEWRAAPDSGELEIRSAHAGEGWLRMQDRVEPAGSGRFMLAGRSDRLVKIEEKRISLDAIEAALLVSGLALEARVILCPEVAGERQSLAAFVVPSDAGRDVLKEGKMALNRRLRDDLAGMVEAVALPRRWRYLDQMPVNAMGKTTQAQLLALLGGVPDVRPREPGVTVLENDGARVLLSLQVPANLFYFDGHFRQAPVLPGVVQVDWAIMLGRRHFALAPSFQGIHALKFQQVIAPEIALFLELKHDAGNGSLHFRYFSDAGPHAGGRILFAS